MHAMTTMPFFYRFRDALATLPSLLILAILIFAGIQKAAKIEAHSDDSLVQIALMEPEPPAPPVTIPTPPLPTPTTPQVVKPQPVPVMQPVRQPQQQPQQQPQTVSATPVSNTPSAEVAATPTPPKAVAAPEPAPAVAKPNGASVEAGYISKVRAHLNSIKRYPTGREASLQRPQGKVRVWFVLNRDGTLAEQGIEESSNSMLLDEAARKTINRATFSAFPESGWVGETTHRFSAELEFIPGAG